MLKAKNIEFPCFPWHYNDNQDEYCGAFPGHNEEENRLSTFMKTN